MNALADVFLSGLDVLKAEWRGLKSDIFRLAMMVALLLTAVVMLVLASAFLLVAFYLTLLEVADLHPALSALLTALFAAAIAAGLYFAASKKKEPAGKGLQRKPAMTKRDAWTD